MKGLRDLEEPCQWLCLETCHTFHAIVYTSLITTCTSIYGRDGMSKVGGRGGGLGVHEVHSLLSDLTRWHPLFWGCSTPCSKCGD